MLEQHRERQQERHKERHIVGKYNTGKYNTPTAKKRSNPKESGQMDFIFKPSKVDLLQFV